MTPPPDFKKALSEFESLIFSDGAAAVCVWANENQAAIKAALHQSIKAVDGDAWQPIDTLTPEPNKSYLVSDGVHRWFAPLSGRLYEDMKDLRDKLAGFEDSEEDGGKRWKPTHWMDTGLPAPPKPTKD
jgi:hypothetical protein